MPKLKIKGDEIVDNVFNLPKHASKNLLGTTNKITKSFGFEDEESLKISIKTHKPASDLKSYTKQKEMINNEIKD